MNYVKYIHGAGAFFLALSVSLPLYAASLKKVLILDFINIDKNSNYQYLEASITDAVREDLKKLFAFRETKKRQIDEVSKTNFLFREDYYTKSTAMNLGLLAKQDVVISGGFKIINASEAKSDELRKEKDTQIIAAQVRIFDIAKKKTIAEFIEEGPVDSRIFASVEKIANRISQEAKAILPNKEDWQKTSAEDENLPPRNQISLMGGISTISIPAAFTDVYTSDTAIVPKDIKNELIFAVEYSRLDLFFADSAIWVQAQYHQGQTELSVAKSDAKAPFSVTSYAVSTGVGYFYHISNWLYIYPFLGGGYFMGKGNLDFTNLEYAPIDMTDNSQKTSFDFNIQAPLTQAGFKTGATITPNLAVESSFFYQHLFFSDTQSGQFFAQLGLAIRI
ncbi:MAG: hypothetical protein OEZ13_11450 [Spirochaetia bacterium]|nr:hypothetical protein [Spirochaetia bacterium]